MAVNIFSLVGKILVDSAEADESIQRTNESAKGLGETFSAGIKTAGKFAAGLATTVAAAATAAGAALNSAVNDAAEYADEIDKASYRSSLGAENLQRLKYAAEQSGATLENIEKSAKKVNERLGELTEDGSVGENAAAMFERLGVAVTNADGSLRDSDSVYNDVLAKLADMGDTAEATSIGTDLFGKAFVDLKPLLAAGSEGINDLMQNADKLGIVMSQDAVTAGVVYGDTLADIKNALGGAARSIGAAVLPTFQRFADKIIEYIPRLQQFIGKVIEPVEKVAESLIDPLLTLVDELLPPLLEFAAGLLEPLAGIMNSILPVIIRLLNKILPVITEIIQELLPPMLEMLDAVMPIIDILLDLLDPVLDLVKALIKPLGQVLSALAPIIEAAVELIDKVLAPYKTELKEMADGLSGVLGVALQLVADLLTEVVVPAFKGLLDFLNGNFMGGLDGFGNAFVGVFESAFGLVDNIFGTHLSEWYAEVQEFMGGFGSYLYEMTHSGEIDEIALHGKYSGLAQDVRLRTNELIRSGMGADEALTKAKGELLKSSEAIYYWDNYGNYDAQQAAVNIKAAEKAELVHQNSADYYAMMGKMALPKLASGGLVYGDTLALVGDNADAAVNPEVVAPLSDLSSAIAKAMESAMAKMPAQTIVVKLSDDTELVRAMIRGINDCTRQDGVCVINGR